MRRILLLLLSCLFMVFCGCEGSGSRRSVGEHVTLSGTDEFPNELAGRWKDDVRKWEIVIAEDGSVTEAVVSPMGWPRLYPERENVIEMREGGKGVFTAGPWYLDYNADTMMMSVEIVLDRFDVEIGPSRLVGTSRDIFQGVVSPDYSTWRVDWYTIPEMKVVANDEEHDLPVNPEEMTFQLEFHKVEEVQ